jgi:hypothetical protein
MITNFSPRAQSNECEKEQQIILADGFDFHNDSGIMHAHYSFIFSIVSNPSSS